MSITLRLGRDKLSDSSAKGVLWQITNIGENKVQNFAGADSVKFRVLSALATLGPSNVESLSSDCHIGKDACEFQLRQLKAERCVDILKTK